MISGQRTEGAQRALAEETVTAPPPLKPMTTSQGSGMPRWTPWLLIVGLVLVALNLRPAVAGLGPLLEEVRAAFGMSGTVAGLLTSVPALCFAVFGSLAPRLARRFGSAAVVAGGMVALAAGLALRPLAGDTAVFLLTTTLALAGIAVSNVLMPVIVRRWFPDRVGTMTGLYSTALALGTAAAAALTVPLTDAVGASWRFGLGMWAGLALLAAVPWILFLLRGRRRAKNAEPAADSEGSSGLAEPAAPPAELRITRSTTAWALGVFFGFQATAAYVIIGWMPQIFRDAGIPASTAGVLLAVTMGMGVPLSFVLPRLAAALSHQGPLVVVLGVCGLAGYTGMWLAPVSGAWVWAVLMGISNCAFPLVLTMIGMRARSGVGVAKLSGFVQSTGYLLSIPGPLLVGVLHESTGGWEGPLLLMGVLMVLQVGVGILAGRHRFIEDGG